MKLSYWGVASVAILLLAGCAQQQKDPALQTESTDKPLTSLDTPPSVTTDPYATDPYAMGGQPKPQDTTGRAAARDDTLVAGGKGGRTHVVQKGDTLFGLSRKYYGTDKRWKDIWEANKSVVPNKDKLTPGTKLVIP